MLRLCYKDYLAGRWLWLSIAILYVLYIIQPMGQSILIMVFGLLAVYGVLAINLIFEDQNRTEILYASLPLKRRTIVRGRYLLAGFIVLGGAAVIFGSAALTLALLKASAYDKALSPLLSREGIAGFLFAAVLFLAVFLPLYYRFGLGKANIILMGGLFLLVLAVAGLERFASGTLGLIPPQFGGGFLRDPGRGMINLVGSAMEVLRPPVFISLALGFSALLVWLSLRVSTGIYERKEF
jgi:hypothetical protein